MATKQMAKSTSKPKAKPIISEEIVEDTFKDVVEEVIEEVVEPKEKRIFEDDEFIPCKSICNGELLIVGDKTGSLYKFADYGDIEGIEYKDLQYMIRSNKPWIKLPRIIILDEDVVDKYPDLQNLYSSIYSKNDFKEILNLPSNKMKQVIEELPSGAKESLLGIARTMIDTGKLDSVSRIKTIDEIFGTELLLALTEN